MNPINITEQCPYADLQRWIKPFETLASTMDYDLYELIHELADAYLDILKDNGNPGHHDPIREARDCPRHSFWEDYHECWHLIWELVGALEDEYLPPYTELAVEDGHHPSEVAVWVRPLVDVAVEDLNAECLAFSDDRDTPDAPDKWHRGLWVFTNDHGNTSLLLRLDDGPGFQDHEIWAVV